jgi:hypothetical protein
VSVPDGLSSAGSNGEDPVRFYPVSEPVEIGDVLVADPNAPGYLRRGGLAEDPGVVGIVAGRAGLALDGGVVATSGAARAPVAFAGIVMCNVDATHGSIRRGDLLTVSPMPGYAMRSTSLTPGTIVGKALADLAEGTGQIPVLAMQR